MLETKSPKLPTTLNPSEVDSPNTAFRKREERLQKKQDELVHLVDKLWDEKKKELQKMTLQVEESKRTFSDHVEQETRGFTSRVEQETRCIQPVVSNKTLVP